MPLFIDISSLCKAIQKGLDVALVSDTAPAVKEVLHDKIEENVYSRYSPTMYQRRGELGSIENMVDELDAPGTLSVRDTADPSPSVIGTQYSPADDTTFSGWINDGNVPNIFNNKHYPWEDPAHFIEDTREELADGKIVKESLKKGLMKQGIKAV